MKMKAVSMGLLWLGAIFFISCSDVPTDEEQKVSQTSHACNSLDQNIIFGPETFVRARGKPKTENRTFMVFDSTKAVIKIRNRGVSSAWIHIDGELIIGPENFKHHKKRLSKNIDLKAGKHKLSVKIGSKPGRKLVVKIVGSETNFSKVCTDGQVVLGPETFTRKKRKPKTETREFSLTHSAETCLIAQNNRVSSAWIHVDGNLIMGPKNFKPHTTYLTKTLRLAAGLHELSVRIASKPGSSLNITIRAQLADPCDGVVCDSPPEDECLDENTLLIYQTPGTCAAGVCSYPTEQQVCPYGCANGACNPPQCESGVCCENGFFKPSGVVCREVAGTCDIEEACTGDNAQCSEDSWKSTGTECRLSDGLCDLAEHCTGQGPICPQDTFAAAGMECRPAAGFCDLAETCTGTDPGCPQDIFVMAGTVCRAVSGPCDVAEVCTGGNPGCPTDELASTGTACRSVVGICDLAEQCTGTDADCPTDQFVPMGTDCRTAAGSCDVAEECTGISGECPADGFLADGTLCRAPAGECDIPETCSGASSECPDDGYMAESVQCRSSVGACDVPESCTGVGAQCPPDDMLPGGTECRAVAGVCDLAEECTGENPFCPLDDFAPTGTECRPAAGICDVAEMCTGADAACPVDMFHDAATECRAAAGDCDIAEYCIGRDAKCPEDGFAQAGTVCRAQAGACDIEESCTGNMAGCPVDTYAASDVLCRQVAGLCDLAESCTGTHVNCPADQFQPDNVQCGSVPIAEEFSCTDQVCGADAITRVQVQYCTGVMAACDESNLVWNDWELIEDCSDGALCESADSSAFCTVCEHGCMDGVCQSGLPPDPSQVAPALDRNGVTPFSQAVSFLYTGTNSIQTGVDPGVLEERRVAVIEGKVMDRNGLPMPGVTVSILDHPELGQTLSRQDGKFDLAVNGGGWLIVQYSKEDYLPVQRKLDTPWNDYIMSPDVVLIPLDNQVTEVFLDSAIDMQVAQGSTVTDEDGTRRATVLFPTGTEAAMVFSDDSTQPLSTLNVRATEYTVGPNGPQTMPGELPPATGYTYAVELSADEALYSGAEKVVFNQPIPIYIENFLEYSVGRNVPAGYYDLEKGEWVAIPDGRIIKIVGIVNGKTLLDIDGDDIADDTTALEEIGITDPEQTRLAVLYSEGQSLWRVMLPHFSPFDFNWGMACLEDTQDKEEPTACKQPKQPEPDDNQPINNPCERYGSIVTCQNQTLGQRIEVEGTSYTLNYRSDRVPGRKIERMLDINVTGQEVPGALIYAAAILNVAGKRIYKEFIREPNQAFRFVWEGKDVYGRYLNGTFPAHINIAYVYPTEPGVSAGAVENGSFGRPPTQLKSESSGEDMRSYFTVYQNFEKPLTIWDEKSRGFGGWSLSMHHAYDPNSQTIYLGNGGRVSQGFIKLVIDTVAGDGRGGPGDDGGIATESALYLPIDVAIGPDGSYYINSYNTIRRVDPGGIITTVAGGGSSREEGIPATDYYLHTPEGIDVDDDGNLYITNYDNVDVEVPHKVHMVDKNGIIRTIAGGRRCMVGDDIGDEGLATEACLWQTYDVVTAPDGAIFISDQGHNRIRRIGPDGIISTYAGGGAINRDGIPATDLMYLSPRYMALARDGSLFVTTDYRTVKRIGPGGIITTVAGGGILDMDDIPATDAYLGPLYGIAVGNQGEIFISEGGRENRIKVVPESCTKSLISAIIHTKL